MKRTKALRKSTYLIITLLLVVAFLVIYIPFDNSFASAATCDQECTFVEEKAYDETTIEEDFDDSCVMVVIDRENSEVNKSHEDKFSIDSNIESIQDLTKINGNVLNKEYLNTEDFHQILKIDLVNKSKQNVLDTIKQIQDIDGVLWAGVNSYDSPTAIDDSSILTADSELATSLPSAVEGSRFAQQWGLMDGYGINAARTWIFYTMGSSSVKVGVIDTGIADHEDLKSNVVTGWDFYNNDDVTNDDPTGHGTHVAGIIGAAGKNANGVVGVNWNVTLVPLQVVNSDNKWPLDTVTAAITWAIDNNIDILNYSGGGSSDDPLRKAALNNYQGLFVCAAGNDGCNNDVVSYYPANYATGETFSDRVISVGAIKSNGAIASYSNYGVNTVSIFAPGDNILSTYPTYLNSSGYAFLNGTSMATPFVTGVASLMYTLYKKSNFKLEDSFIAAQVKTTLLLGCAEDDMYYGKCTTGGTLNAEPALEDMPIREVINGFGYTGSWYKWTGKVELLVDRSELFYLDSIDRVNIAHGTDFTFLIGSTGIIYNAWTEITGTIKVELTNYAGEIVPIGGKSSQTCQVKVGIVSNATLTNNKFVIKSGELPHDVYTLSITSTFTRGSTKYTDSKGFVFVVW